MKKKSCFRSCFENNSLNALCIKYYYFVKKNKLLIVLNLIKKYKSLYGGREAFVIGLEISKVFDQVWHKNLLAKLPAFGLPPCRLCKWLESFLSNRSIKV